MQKKLNEDLIVKSISNLSVALAVFLLLGFCFYTMMFAAAALMIFRLLN